MARFTMQGEVTCAFLLHASMVLGGSGTHRGQAYALSGDSDLPDLQDVLDKAGGLSIVERAQ